MHAWSQDDRGNPSPTVGAAPDARLDIYAADLRLELGRFGHGYVAGSYTNAQNVATLSRVISVLNTNVTDEGLKHLKNLKNLRILMLSDTQVTDAGLEHLKQLPNLREVHLDGTPTTAAGREKLRQAIQELEIK